MLWYISRAGSRKNYDTAGAGRRMGLKNILQPHYIIHDYSFSTYLSANEEKITDILGKKRKLKGPDGSVASSSIEIVDLAASGLQRLETICKEHKFYDTNLLRYWNSLSFRKSVAFSPLQSSGKNTFTLIQFSWVALIVVLNLGGIFSISRRMGLSFFVFHKLLINESEENAALVKLVWNIYFFILRIVQNDIGTLRN